MFWKRIIVFSFLLFVFVIGKTQVNLQTGSAVFSLPMFNWQDDKSRLTSVVALSYNSGNGLRVNDVASNVGQGWSLVAGGVISRMQVGEPDDQPAYYTNMSTTQEQDNDLTKYPAGYLYHTIDPANGCPNALTKYPIFGAKNQLYAPHNLTQEDRELDRFSFQFNGKSGMFVLDTTGGDHGIPLGDTKLKITFQRDPTMTNQGIRTTITSFSIQDVDGLIYKFTTHGLTRVLCEEFCDQKVTVPIAQPNFGVGNVYFQAGFQIGFDNKVVVNPYIISNWYLSEIDDPLTARKILFSYTSLTVSNTAGADVSYNQWHDYIIVSSKTSVTVNQEISSITYPDGHTVTFKYSPYQRVDLSNEFAMSAVDIQYQGRYLSEYQLNTTYFIKNKYGNPVLPDEKNFARLCLKSVKKLGVDLKEDSPPYTFEYYQGSNASDDYVPPSFCYQKDVWGFYNGSNSVRFDNSQPVTAGASSINLLNYYELKGLCFLNPSTANSYTDPVSGQPVYGVYLNSKAGYAQNGLLKEIIYPTGGSITYQYAQNMGNLNGTGDVMVGGVHVSQTSSSDGGYSNDCNNAITTQYNYVTNGTGSSSSLWGLEPPANMIVSGSHYAPEQRGFHCSFSSGCVFYYHYMYPGILSLSEAASLSTFQNIMNAIAPYLTILSVVMDVIDIINVIGPETGWGEIVAVVLDIVSTVVTIVLSYTANYSKDGATPIYHNSNLNEAGPLPTQYKRVEVVENPGTIGKTVQEFTSSDDYALWLPSANTDFAVKQRFAPWAYGLPKLTTIYDASGNMIKQTKNVYDFTNAQRQITTGPVIGTCPKCFYTGLESCKCTVGYSYSQRNVDWTSINNYKYDPVNYPANYTTSSNSNMTVDIYSLYTGRVELDSSYEKVYRVGDASNFVQTVTAYQYNYLYNFDVNQITSVQSNGDVNYKNIKYTSDFSGGPLTTLINNNIVSLPVATTSSVLNSSTSAITFLSEKVTEFAQVSNGDIKPSRIIEQRFNQPASGIVNYSGPATTNYSVYKIPQVFTYDANSNLTGVKDEGGRSVTNIYDYNDKYITASVINADPVADKPAYTSFESQDLTRSGWLLTGPAGYNLNVTSPTGVNTFTLQASGANSLTASSLNTSRPYILSFWASNGNVSVTGGATLVKSAPTYNGFTYYEYSIAQGTASVIVKNTSSSAVSIDELRLYPKTARMRTTTYDPLIGKTSECDENNRIVYYAYDNLGRMQFIEDENKNVVKMYEYNNVSPSKRIGCPTSFQSRLLSETITRSNCASGYQPGTAIFTIPAGKYSSTTSQFDADMQAEIDLLTNGQAYANTNGSCSLLYYNTVQSQSDSTQTCNESAGYKGGWVTYTVPAGRYSSIISQADANQQALTEIAANAQAYANDPAHAVCTLTTAADWTWLEGAPTYCLSVNGNLPPHLFVQETDINPGSSTYNQTRWSDAGAQSTACPANLYYNASQSQVFTRTNASCGTGYTGGSYTYTVQPGTYSSSVSQAAANQLATNDINANGQNAANTYGPCTQTTITLTYSNTKTVAFNITLTNTTTGINYHFTANANTSSGTLGTVPNGTYGIQMCPTTGSGTYNFSVFHSYYATSVTCGNFTSIPITSNGTLYMY
ncbi:MAG: hypothetical protein JST87_18655 [Bacteroidetes bacterium]|nr:hypothetical protein [Bacteroidota bacterium]